jgi:hypothetical protein
MREIQLKISDDLGVSLGVIELENFKDFPLTLTKAIGDLNEFTKRKNDYSLDFDIPRTQNNNQILFGIANVNGVNDSLKLLGRRKCTILVDNNQISYGFIRIYESKNKDSYKANFSGGNGDWVELLSNINLNQLEWIAEIDSGTKYQETYQSYNDPKLPSRVNDYDNFSWFNIFPKKEYIYEEGIKIIKELGLNFKNRNDWKKYIKGEFDSRLPKNPQGYFEIRKIHFSWGEWLGNGNIRNGDREYYPIEKSMEILQKIGIENTDAFKKYRNSKDFDEMIPQDPQGYYTRKNAI